MNETVFVIVILACFASGLLTSYSLGKNDKQDDDSYQDRVG